MTTASTASAASSRQRPGDDRPPAPGWKVRSAAWLGATLACSLLLGVQVLLASGHAEATGVAGFVQTAMFSA